MPKKKNYAKYSNEVHNGKMGVAIYLNGRKEFSTFHTQLISFVEELSNLIDWGYEIRITYPR